MSTPPQSISSPSSFTPQASGGKALLIVLAALVLSSLAIGSYVYCNPDPAKVGGQVEQVWAYPVHRVSTVGAGGSGMLGGEQTFDQVIVLAKVKLSNQGKIPLYVHDMWAVADLPTDGAVSETSGPGKPTSGESASETPRAVAIGPSDFKRVFVAYQETAAHQEEAPLLRDTTIEPGQSVEGMMIFSYPATRQQWDARRSFDVTISLLHQPDLTLRAPPS